jgi:predicted PurR-regulated permease PerM
MSTIEDPETQFEQTETARIISERPRIETICLVFISLVAAVFLLRYGQAIFLPFVLSLLLFYALDPVVCWMSRFRIPRIVGCLLLVATFLGTGASGAYLLRDQASDTLGMLLAVPIMMTIKSICDHIEGLQPIGHLLGER